MTDEALFWRMEAERSIRQSPSCKEGFHNECEAPPGASMYPCKCSCHYRQQEAR